MTVTISVDAEAEMVIHNSLIRGNVHIQKICSLSGEPLKGAEFGLFTLEDTENSDYKHENDATEPDGETFDKPFITAVSGENGIVVFESIPYGVYELRELVTAEGYILIDEVFKIEITEEGLVVELTVENDPIEDEEDEEQEEENEEDIPRTGDDRRLQWLSLILSVIIIVGCGVTLYTLNKADKLHKESDGDDEKDT
jgi:uncharacterized surface anchored protein